MVTRLLLKKYKLPGEVTFDRLLQASNKLPHAVTLERSPVVQLFAGQHGVYYVGVGTPWRILAPHHKL